MLSAEGPPPPGVNAQSMAVSAPRSDHLDFLATLLRPCEREAHESSPCFYVLIFLVNCTTPILEHLLSSLKIGGMSWWGNYSGGARADCEARAQSSCTSVRSSGQAAAGWSPGAVGAAGCLQVGGWAGEAVQ